MQLKNKYFLYIFTILCLILEAQAGEWSGYIAGELRYFPESPLSNDQYEGANFSLSAQPQYSHEWDDGDQSFTFVPFVRLDEHDSERSHFDIRELTWLKASKNGTWELRVGIRKVFWGVTESQHLVDIINQTDLVEHFDGEEKLGQPMINLALISENWGTLDLFILPGFRERTFPGRKGRLQLTSIPIDTDQVRYESGAKEKHVDLAMRWGFMLGDDLDIGLSHFSGTSREASLVAGLDNQGRLVLIPYYEQIEQTGLDLQFTQEAMLWKLEMISRKNQQGRFTALTGGFEYTFVRDSGAEIGLLTEYLFDDRHDNATLATEDDIMLGLRLTLNDEQSTELLAGGVFDLNSSAAYYLLEASRRLGENWKLSLESYIYSQIPPDDISYGFRNEDFVQLELAWYF